MYVHLNFGLNEKNFLGEGNKVRFDVSLSDKKNSYNIKINAIEGGLTLTATDLIMELSESLPAKVSSPGGVTISSQLFFEIIRKAPDHSDITLKVDEKSGSVFVLFYFCYVAYNNITVFSTFQS